MQGYVNTTCNIMRRSAKRCRQVLFEFWFWRATHSSFKITGGLGARPQTKLTISAAEILSIHRKCTYTFKSRDSRKSSKKQNRWMADFAFCLGRDCKAVALKYNDFMKHGASNLFLGRQLFLSCQALLAPPLIPHRFTADDLFGRDHKRCGFATFNSGFACAPLACSSALRVRGSGKTLATASESVRKSSLRTVKTSQASIFAL